MPTRLLVRGNARISGLPKNTAVSVLTTKNAKSTKNVSNITNFSVFFAFFVVKIGVHLTLSQCFFAAKPRGWLSGRVIMHSLKHT